MGDCFLDGNTALREYTIAYRLAKEQGRPVDDLLRMLGKQMEVETRWTGSVGDHIGPDEMSALETEARELLKGGSDTAALAKIHIALAGA